VCSPTVFATATCFAFLRTTPRPPASVPPPHPLHPSHLRLHHHPHPRSSRGRCTSHRLHRSRHQHQHKLNHSPREPASASSDFHPPRDAQHGRPGRQVPLPLLPHHCRPHRSIRRPLPSRARSPLTPPSSLRPDWPIRTAQSAGLRTNCATRSSTPTAPSHLHSLSPSSRCPSSSLTPSPYYHLPHPLSISPPPPPAPPPLACFPPTLSNRHPEARCEPRVFHCRFTEPLFVEPNREVVRRTSRPLSGVFPPDVSFPNQRGRLGVAAAAKRDPPACSPWAHSSTLHPEILPCSSKPKSCHLQTAPPLFLSSIYTLLNSARTCAPPALQQHCHHEGAVGEEAGTPSHICPCQQHSTYSTPLHTLMVHNMVWP